MSGRKDSAAIVGVGAAACAVCCAGPILAFLAAIGVGSVLGFALFGFVGLAVVAVGGLLLYRRRRRRVADCIPVVESVAVTLESPKVRSS